MHIPPVNPSQGPSFPQDSPAKEDADAIENAMKELNAVFQTIQNDPSKWDDPKTLQDFDKAIRDLSSAINTMQNDGRVSSDNKNAIENCMMAFNQIKDTILPYGHFSIQNLMDNPNSADEEDFLGNLSDSGFAGGYSDVMENSITSLDNYSPF